MTFAWTPENVERLREMVADGKSGAEIAAALGVTRNMVLGKASRLRDIQLHGAPKGKEHWTDEDLRTLLAMAREGKSAKEVAAAVGRKPSSVYAAASLREIKFHAHRMPKPAVARALRRHTYRAPTRSLVQALACFDAIEPTPDMPPPAKPIVPAMCGETYEHPTITELKPGHCRFPLWTGRFVAATSRFCGQAKVDGRSWCAAHMPVVFSASMVEAA
jgi:hypothetical protein